MSKNSEKKERSSIWLSPQTLKKCDAAVVFDDCKSRSEFVEKAIIFYTGHLASKSNSEFLSVVISEMVEGIILNTEKRVSRLQFKQAVELAKMSKLIASAFEVDEETLHQLHIDCVNEVKKINGVIKMTPSNWSDD